MPNDSIKKREILDIIDTSNNKTDAFQSISIYIIKRLNMPNLEGESEWLKQLKIAISTIKSRRKQKWESVKRIKSKFESKFGNWMDSKFEVPDTSMYQPSSTSHDRQGRPSKSFNDMADRSKRRLVANISSKNDHDPIRIIMACKYAARHSGKSDLASVLKRIEENPTVVRQILEKPKECIKKMTAEKALSYLLDRSLSKEDYISMRLLVKEHGADIFPAYDHVRAAKEMCRPPKNLMKFTETKAEVPLQALLNHTVKRIIQLQSDVLHHCFQNTNIKEIEAVLICSWGFDGSSGHSSYKQQYNDKTVDIDDENLLATTLIPLRLITESNDILWNNRTSQSVRFCRPIRLQYIKESGDIIKNEYKNINMQIDNLEKFEVLLTENQKICIHFNLFLTLIDGKVLNYITDTKSMQTCPLCHATPRQFNNISNINKETDIFLPDPKSLQYGISPLHAWIRLLECCLHISYRLGVKTWQMRSDEQKDYFRKRKIEIQKILWDKLGIKVDKVKAGGSGTSNDGNTARRAFENPEIFSKCLGLDPDMIRNFKHILIALSCQFPINPVRFDELCSATAKIYVNIYNWFPMPSTVHKILIHGAAIVKHSLLPVGMLGEEASESRNKDYKRFRYDHTRKFTRRATLEDLFNRVVDSSDPVISTLSLDSRLKKNKYQALPKEVINLFDIPKINETGSNPDKSEEDSSGLPEFYEKLCNIELNEEQ